jgi:putative toxin-antitoxin system antitoxin component (TIGR02293 family)
MEVIKKKPSAKRRVVKALAEKERKPLVRDIMGNIEKWSVNKKIEVIESGISKSEFEKVKKETGLDYEILSHILRVTKATLHNKKGDSKFNAVVSERLLLLAEIYVYGIEVFGEKERFNRWLVSNIRALGGRRPIDYLQTLHGITEIKHLIGRIDYGVYS